MNTRSDIASITTSKRKGGSATASSNIGSRKDDPIDEEKKIQTLLEEDQANIPRFLREEYTIIEYFDASTRDSVWKREPDQEHRNDQPKHIPIIMKERKIKGERKKSTFAKRAGLRSGREAGIVGQTGLARWTGPTWP